jgi:outer membrane protein assembly factor BamB
MVHVKAVLFGLTLIIALSCGKKDPVHPPASNTFGNLKREAVCLLPLPSDPDGTVYVGSDDNKLYAINGKSGVKLWEFETGSYVFSSPAIGSDGTVYVGSFDKKLYAINGKTGVKLWEFETGDCPVNSSPAIGI